MELSDGQKVRIHFVPSAGEGSRSNLLYSCYSVGYRLKIHTNTTGTRGFARSECGRAARNSRQRRLSSRQFPHSAEHLGGLNLKQDL